MKIKVLCGVSGSGKSTYIKNNFPNAEVCSADHFFMVDGEYKFDPSKLPQAHGECLKKFVGLISNVYLSLHDVTVVVDNTNTTISEIAPYAALAQAYGHELEIIIIEVSGSADLEVAWKRNAHGVPLQGITNQYSRLVKLADQLPPWWKLTKVQMETGAPLRNDGFGLVWDE